jgi:hypothetical protein
MKKNTLKTVKAVGEVFAKGFRVQLIDEGTCGLGCVLGIHQGLKYKGSLKTGLATCGIVVAGISIVNGVRSIIVNADYIRQKGKVRRVGKITKEDKLEYMNEEGKWVTL